MNYIIPYLARMKEIKFFCLFVYDIDIIYNIYILLIKKNNIFMVFNAIKLKMHKINKINNMLSIYYIT